MAIDRIGRGSAPPPPKPATEAEKPRGAEAPRAFELHAGAPLAAPVAPAAPSAASPLERLRRGEVDLDGYLDLKVEEATVHLRGLRSAEIEGIRAALRDHVSTDPALAELVRRATDQVPRAKE